MYGGLCAGATSANCSIVAITSSVTRTAPLIGPPCTALNPIASGFFGSSFRMTSITSACVGYADPACPIRSYPHCASTSPSASMSNNLNLNDVLPRLATRTSIFVGWALPTPSPNERDSCDRGGQSPPYGGVDYRLDP